MRFSTEHIKQLQNLLKEQTGREYTSEEAQEAGLSIMRLVIAKEQRKIAKSKQRDNVIES